MFNDPHKILDGFESLCRHHYAKQELREAQLRKIPIYSADKILDIGIGPGLYLQSWFRDTAAARAEFFAFDHSEIALEFCRKEAEKAGALDRFHSLQGDMYELRKLAIPEINVVFIGNTLEYIPDPVAYLRDEVMPLLARGGRIAVRDLDCSLMGCNLLDPALVQKIVYSRVRNGQEISKTNYHNPFIGRDLGRILREAGLLDVQVTPYLVEFPHPLTAAQKDYLSRLHTTWYVDDALSILTRGERAHWAERFDVNRPDSVLHDPNFYYTEAEFLAQGRID